MTAPPIYMVDERCGKVLISHDPQDFADSYWVEGTDLAIGFALGEFFGDLRAFLARWPRCPECRGRGVQRLNRRSDSWDADNTFVCPDCAGRGRDGSWRKYSKLREK